MGANRSYWPLVRYFLSDATSRQAQPDLRYRINLRSVPSIHSRGVSSTKCPRNADCFLRELRLRVATAASGHVGCRSFRRFHDVRLRQHDTRILQHAARSPRAWRQPQEFSDALLEFRLPWSKIEGPAIRSLCFSVRSLFKRSAIGCSNPSPPGPKMSARVVAFAAVARLRAILRNSPQRFSSSGQCSR